MAFSLLLYVTIFLFSLLFLSIAYKKRTRKSPVSVSYSQQLSLLPPPSRPVRTYDVFLNFRSEDTRNNFVGHLYKALDRYGIYTFKDDEKLKKGKTVAPELLKSIEESRYSIVILSKNYATSTWCLDELVKIIHCMEQFGQIVVPIFYNVDPLDVRKQTGSFKRAFDNHERAFKKEKVLLWREALKMVCSIAASYSRNRDESVLIEEIVRDVSDKLFFESSTDDNKLVGMSDHMKQMNSFLLCNDGSEEVLMVGIYGMGGIGKTTISTALYNRYSRHYDGSCYVSNVKDNFRKHGPSFLRERLLSEIFRDKNLNIRTLNENFNVIKERLSRKNVLIVLDDVDGMEQLENLADKHEWFGPGSRIIITTRNQRLLISHGVNYLYEVPNLRDHEAFQLFSQYAFKQDKPTPDYLKLSYQFVLYAKGHPLALKILGSFLYNKSINEWVSELKKLKKFPNAEIQDLLGISFDGLDDKQKDIFLDIACFFIGEDKDLLIDIWESCGFFPETGLRVLEEKSLIITDKRNKLEMHDLLCEMGKEVVRQESTKEPGERSRLWFPEDICYVFKHNTGTKSVEGIFLDISNIEELQLTRETFRKMHNLRLLKIYNSSWDTREFKETIKVHLPHGLLGLSDELRSLYWHGYPLKSLPCNFQPENLVELIMPYSNLKNPREATKNMKNLKRLDLSYSRNLKDIGDLSLARNLECINLEGCISLQVIHSSIQYLNKLKELKLKDCKNLRSPLETIAGLVSLEYLYLSGCSKITELPNNLGKMSSLVVLEGEKIGINRLPSSVSDMKSLTKMLLSGCKGKHSAGLLLPRLWGLDSLRVLELKDFNILEFPEDTLRLSSLETLDLSGNSFERIDLSLGPLSNLKELKLNECKMLQSISNLPSNIRRLQAHNCSSLDIVSSSISKSKCDVWEINLLKSQFVFTNCFNLKHISLRNIMIDLLERLQVWFASIKEIQDLVERFGGKIPVECMFDMILSIKFDKEFHEGRKRSPDEFIREFHEGRKRSPDEFIREMPSFGLLRRKISIDQLIRELKDLYSHVRLCYSGSENPVEIKFPNMPSFGLLRRKVSIDQLIKEYQDELENEIQDLSQSPSFKFMKEFHEGRKRSPDEFIRESDEAESTSFKQFLKKRIQDLSQSPSFKFIKEFHEGRTRSPEEFIRESDQAESTSFKQFLKKRYQDELENEINYIERVWRQNRRRIYNDLISNVRLCYPGSEIPEWFTHQNVGDSLTLQLQSSEMNSTLKGFIFCAVVAFDDYCHDYSELRYDIHLTRLNIFESFDFETYFEKESYINSDHVLIGVAFRTPSAFFEKANLNSDHVVMKFFTDEDFSRCKVKRCGVRPIYVVECKEQQKYKLSFGNATSFSLTTA